jgi:hypothetical protein
VRGIDSDFEEETQPSNVSEAELRLRFQRLRGIESRSYDDDDGECRGCY